MAWRVTSAATSLVRTANVPGTVWTAMGWFMPLVDRNAISTWLSVDNNAGFNSIVELTTTTSGTNVVAKYVNNAGANGASTTIQNILLRNWYFGALTRNGTAVTGYLRHSNWNYLKFQSVTISGTINGPSRFRAGDDGDTSTFFNGRVAGVKLWDGVVLTRDEILKESYQLAPRTRFYLLNLWWQENTGIDLSGRSRHVAPPSTNARELGPPVALWRNQPVILDHVSVVAGGTTVDAGVVAHTYTAVVPQVRARVQPAAASKSYSPIAPRFIGTVRAPAAAKTYTAHAPQVRARVQPGAVTHSYVPRTPPVQARVQPAAATKTYQGRVPNISAGGAVVVPATTVTYTARVPQVRVRVQPAPASAVYTGQTPTLVHTLRPPQATKSYTPRLPQVRASVAPQAVPHTYTGRVPQAKAMVRPSPASITYTGRVPGVFSLTGIVAPTAAHSYLPRNPQARQQVQVPAVAVVYTGRAPALKGPITYGRITLSDRSALWSLTDKGANTLTSGDRAAGGLALEDE